MPGTMTLWNVTPATQSVPTNVRIYRKTILPGRSAEVDAKWVHQYPKALQGAVTARKIHAGPALPSWYNQMLEEKMPKRLKNISDKPVTIGHKTKGLSPTMFHPGEETILGDDTLEKAKDELAAQPLLQLTDLEETTVPAPEPEPEPEPVKEEAPELPTAKVPAKSPAKKPAKNRRPAKGKKK